jgi:hypothetical protein
VAYWLERNQEGAARPGANPELPTTSPMTSPARGRPRDVHADESRRGVSLSEI